MNPDIIRMELSVDSLVPDPENPNEMPQAEMDLLVENIQQVGFIDPVTVVPIEGKKYKIIGGEHRWKAAKILAMDTIPADVLQGKQWSDPDHCRFQNVRLNVIHGKLNPEKMAKMYGQAYEKYGEKATRLLGFSSDEALKKLVKKAKKEIQSALPPAMAKEFEEQAQKARSAGDLGRIVQHMFDEYGDTVKHGYMIFAWGGKEHVYIATTHEVQKAIKKIVAKAKKDNVDANAIIGEAMIGIAESIADDDSSKE